MNKTILIPLALLALFALFGAPSPASAVVECSLETPPKNNYEYSIPPCSETDEAAGACTNTCSAGLVKIGNACYSQTTTTQTWQCPDSTTSSCSYSSACSESGTQTTRVYSCGSTVGSCPSSTFSETCTRNTDGNSCGTSGQCSNGSCVVPDTTAPSGSVSINDGASATTARSVTLSLSCSDNKGCSAMQVNNTFAQVTSSAVQSYQSSLSWTLSSGEGTKGVYARYRDAAGNWSSIVSDTIVYQLPDTTAPSVSVTGGSTTWKSSAAAGISCSDAGSGCDASSYQYTTSSFDPVSCPTAASQYTTVSPNITSRTWVCGLAKDNAGNTGFSSPAEFRVDSAAPLVGSMAASDENPQPDQAVSFSASVSESGGSGLSSCSLQVDGAVVSPMAVSGGTASTTHAFGAEGSFSARSSCRDGAGNAGTGSAITVTVADTVRPTATVSTDKTSYAPGETITITVTGTDERTVGNMSVTYGGILHTQWCGESSCTKTWTTSESSSTTYYAYVYDVSGNIAPIPSASVSVVLPPNSVTVDKSAYFPGDEISIAVTASDKDGVTWMYAKYGDVWHNKWCGQLSCTKTWTTSESSPGTYDYYGFLYDRNGTGTWISPAKAVVSTCGKRAERPSDSIPNSVAACNLTITHFGEDLTDKSGVKYESALSNVNSRAVEVDDAPVGGGGCDLDVEFENIWEETAPGEITIQSQSLAKDAANDLSFGYTLQAQGCLITDVERGNSFSVDNTSKGENPFTDPAVSSDQKTATKKHGILRNNFNVNSTFVFKLVSDDTAGPSFETEPATSKEWYREGELPTVNMKVLDDTRIVKAEYVFNDQTRTIFDNREYTSFEGSFAIANDLWDATTQDGSHSGTLRVFDAAGNKAERTFTVRKDTTGPSSVANIENAKSGSLGRLFVGVDGANISVTESDAGSGLDVTGCSYSVAPFVDGILQSEKSSVPRSCGQTFHISSIGTDTSSCNTKDGVPACYIKLDLYDQAGNGRTYYKQVNVDTTPPRAKEKL